MIGSSLFKVMSQFSSGFELDIKVGVVRKLVTTQLEFVHSLKRQDKTVNQPLRPPRIFCSSSFSPDIETLQYDPAGALAFSALFG